MTDSVNIFGQLDYRALLAELFAARKAAGRGFSHRAFARRVGLRSTNFLKLVMDGQRNLSAEMAQRFATGFGLDREASSYFCDLVAYNQAKSAAERARSYERLMRHRRPAEMRKLDAEQARYYESWYVPAIRELVRTQGFREEPKWIAKQLLPRITPAEVRRAIETLLSLGLLRRDEAGVLRQSDPIVTAGKGPLSHHVVSYHRAMLERASESLDLSPRDEREIASLTLSASESVMAELKRRITEFRAELLEYAERHPAAERVVQINFQLFPLSNRSEDPSV